MLAGKPFGSSLVPGDLLQKEKKDKRKKSPDCIIVFVKAMGCIIGCYFGEESVAKALALLGDDGSFASNPSAHKCTAIVGCSTQNVAYARFPISATGSGANSLAEEHLDNLWLEKNNVHIYQQQVKTRDVRGFDWKCRDNRAIIAIYVGFWRCES